MPYLEHPNATCTKAAQRSGRKLGLMVLETIALHHHSLGRADDFAQLLQQRLRGNRKLDKMAGLECDIAAL